MSDGYIKLFRKFMDNPIWRESREFSKAEAWIDIIFEARYAEDPDTVIIGEKTLACNRGESLNSLSTWARRWGMSRSKARRVLDLFRRCNMIELHDERITTRLKVLQYSVYADSWNASETQVKRKRNASETHLDPEEERKKDERRKEGNLNPPIPQEGEQEKPDRYHNDSLVVLEYLNQKWGSSFKPVKANLQFITGRLRDGYSVKDLKQVIYWVGEVWPDDKNLANYFPRTDTPFRPQKFSNNLERARRWWDNGKKTYREESPGEATLRMGEELMRKMRGETDDTEEADEFLFDICM